MKPLRPPVDGKLEALPRKKEAILDRVLDGETVLFNLSTNKLHSLNVTASFIWEHCTGENTVSKIGELLSQSFAVTGEQAQADLQPLLCGMQQAGLIEL